MQKHNWELDSKTANIYRNIEKQIEKLFRHTRQGAFKTRERYQDGVKHFGKFVTEAFRKQNLNNIQGKHLEAYVEQMKEAGYSNSYITTNLSAIRYFVDQLPGGDSTRLPTNDQLEVGRSQAERLGPDRSWRQAEFDQVKQIAKDNGNQRIADMMQIAKDHGLRIHEVTRLDKAQLGQALKSGMLTVKGKGGLVRQVPLHNRDHIEKLHRATAPGQKVFVESGEKTHHVIQQAKNFISNHRPATETGRGNLSFHGLRHTYAQGRYSQLLTQGLSEKASMTQVSKELGHFRPEITKVYLSKGAD